MDSQKCEAAGKHQIATRHSLKECPVEARDAQDIMREFTAKQGWNLDTRYDLVTRYIDMLGGSERPPSFEDFLKGIANEENGVTKVPDLSMDVRGEYSGNAYPEQKEYRISMTVLDSGDFRLVVEDAAGGIVGSMTMDDEVAEGIDRMATTDHGLGAYEDDWKLPAGMDRALEWTLQTDMEHEVRLDQTGIDEIAAWLRYATGEMDWDGGEDWEY